MKQSLSNSDSKTDFSSLIQSLRKATQSFTLPSVSQISLLEKDRPFRVLISCLLSLRTKDEVTFPASERLFQRAASLKVLSQLPPSEIEKIIYPVGFYKTKAKLLPEVCKHILREFGGKVPEEIEDLIKIKGVGRKTANLVRGLGYGKPAVCVDTHVHRISNRLGLFKTKNAEETEYKLREILPQRYWIEYNDLLVTWGQNICKPISPLCSRCPLNAECPKVEVTHKR